MEAANEKSNCNTNTIKPDKSLVNKIVGSRIETSYTATMLHLPLLAYTFVKVVDVTGLV